MRLALQLLVRSEEAGAGSAISGLQVGDLAIDLQTQEVARGGKPVALTVREYQVLEYLMRNRGRVLSRAVLEEHVWG